MCDSELLRASHLASSLQPPSPWHTDNLRVVEAGSDDEGPYVVFDGLDPTRNGHLEQVCDVADHAGKGTFSVCLSLCLGIHF